MRSSCRWFSQWCLLFALLEVDATLGDVCEIWEYLHSFRDVKLGFVVSQRFHHLLLCRGKLRDSVSPRIPCVTPVIKSFSSDLLQALISYWTESHLESCQTSTMELFWENSQRTKDLNYFREKAPPKVFD